MKLIKTKKQLDKAFDNIESGKSSLIIKQATDYSNLSQWIQMEFFKYAEIHKHVRMGDMVEPAHKLADRIIKQVLEDKNLVNNKVHKEGFDSGYKKGYKEGKKQTIIDIVEGRIELPQL